MVGGRAAGTALLVRLPVLAVLIVAAAGPVTAQEAGGVRALLSRADSAFERGDSAAAERGYAAVLEADPWSSRAAYQLARLQPPGSPEAVRLFRRYTDLEPDDAWGFIALGQALVDAGRSGDAVSAYAAAVARAPEARAGRVGLARALALAERTDRAISAWEEWLALDAQDGEAWEELARQRQKAGRLREAAEALGQAAALRPERSGTLAERLETVRALAAPTLSPLAGGSGDSDGNRVTTLGLRGELTAADRLRLGVAATRVRADDGVSGAEAIEAAATADWRPRRTLHVSGALGASRAGEETVPVARLRARWTAPGAGPTGELRVRREPLTASPLLLSAPVVLAEGRGTADVSLAGPLRLRALGRIGSLSAPGHANRRLAYGGGPVVRIAPAAEVSASYQELHYDDPATVGYFAPARVQTVEVASYLEWYGAWPLVLAVDVGGGAQRLTDHGAEPDRWRRALRLWSLVSWTVRPGRALQLEIEAYDAVIGDAPAPDAGTDPSWRYGSARLGLFWGF